MTLFVLRAWAASVAHRTLLAALFACVPLSCAYCGGAEKPHTPIGAHGNSVPDTAVGVDTPVPGIDLPQGNCPVDMFLSTDKRCVPLQWHCPPAYYDGGLDDGCDCHCGTIDPDCNKPFTQAWCYTLGQLEKVPNCRLCSPSKGASWP